MTTRKPKPVFDPEDYAMNYKKPIAITILIPLLGYLGGQDFLKHQTLKSAYRSALGVPISIGVLIPNELYKPEINGIPVETLIANKSFHRYIPNYFLANKELLSYCQKVIDFNDAGDAYKKLKALRDNILITEELFENLLRAKKRG